MAKYRHADIAFSVAVTLDSFNSLWWVRLGYAREQIKEYRYSLEVNYAFSNCTALEQVTIGNGVKKIYSAFNGCSKLPRIHIPASVTELHEVFADCTALKIGRAHV